MFTFHSQLTRLTMFAAILAAAVTVQAAPQPVRTVQLAPVTVVAHRVPVVQLDRVVVVAKRAAPAATVLAQRAPRATRV